MLSRSSASSLVSLAVLALTAAPRAQPQVGELVLVGQGADPVTGQGSTSIPEVVVVSTALTTTRLTVSGINARISSITHDPVSGAIYVGAGARVYLLLISGTNATGVQYCATPTHGENWQLFMGHRCLPVAMRPNGQFLECPAGGPATNLFPSNPFTRLEAGWFDRASGYYFAVDQPVTGSFQLYRIDPIGPVFTPIGATFGGAGPYRVFPDGAGGAYLASGSLTRVNSAGVRTTITLTPGFGVCRMSPLLGATGFFRAWACAGGPDPDVVFVDAASGTTAPLLTNVPNFNAPGAVGGGIWDVVEIGAAVIPTPFGTACIDSGAIPNVLTVAPCPQRGGTLSVAMATGSAGPCSLAIGFVPTTPIDLTIIGATNCSLYALHHIVVPMGPNTGSGTSLVIPIHPFDDPTFFLTLQGYHIDFAANPLGIVSSNGVDLQI